MTDALQLDLVSETLEVGSAEERACFGTFTMKTPAQSLTDVFDGFVKTVRQGPRVSGYHLAEWFAWNWWRLMWEPRTKVADWHTAHKLTSIGEGYHWPPIEIVSDGERTVILSNASSNPEVEPYRYIGAQPVIIPTSTFQGAVQRFQALILGRLELENISGTNLHKVWNDVREEMHDPQLATRRKLEALMSKEPGEADDGILEPLIEDLGKFDEASAEEMAAGNMRFIAATGHPLNSKTLRELSGSYGVEISAGDLVTLSGDVAPGPLSNIPAWKVGGKLARSLRAQEKIRSAKITNKRLADMLGADEGKLLGQKTNGFPVSFMLDEPDSQRNQLVVSGSRKTATRFAAARILGDHLLDGDTRLNLVSTSLTYRQKAQRAFAAEFLAPFDAVDEYMQGDYSDEKQQDAAEHFAVSPMCLHHILNDNGRLRDEPFREDFREVS